MLSWLDGHSFILLLLCNQFDSQYRYSRKQMVDVELDISLPHCSKACCVAYGGAAWWEKGEPMVGEGQPVAAAASHKLGERAA